MTKSNIATGLLPAVLVAGAFAGVADGDPHLWLENVTGEAALAWVQQRNQRTFDAYAQLPVFAATEDRFKRILDSDERIPYIWGLGDAWYNFWRDADNPRGLWRRTTLEE